MCRKVPESPVNQCTWVGFEEIIAMVDCRIFIQCIYMRIIAPAAGPLCASWDLGLPPCRPDALYLDLDNQPVPKCLMLKWVKQWQLPPK